LRLPIDLLEEGFNVTWNPPQAPQKTQRLWEKEKPEKEKGF
jgi:hypothetical protein